MTYINQIAYHLGRRDEVPNQELAAKLARENNQTGINEIASYLHDKNKSIQSDCLKVLYETGYLAPELITKHTPTFIELLDSKTNRMVWGAMIALATVAELVPEEIWPQREKIKTLAKTGTVITNVWGVKTLINLSKPGDKYYSGLVGDLFEFQRECRDIDFAKRAEDMWEAVRVPDRDAYRAILEERLPKLSNAAQKRLARVIKKMADEAFD